MINTIEELMATCGYKTKKEIDWKKVSWKQKLSEEFIREFKDSVDWLLISVHQKLSEPFIKEFKGRVYWEWISRCQKLSEGFIREFKDKVGWLGVSYSQKLSEDFIREFKGRVTWVYISHTQKLSDEFIEEFKDCYEEPEYGRVLASEFYCGNENRVIIIYSEDPTKIRISCFVGTQAEAIEAITKKYGETEVGLDYKAKVNKCFESVKGVE